MASVEQPDFQGQRTILDRRRACSDLGRVTPAQTDRKRRRTQKRFSDSGMISTTWAGFSGRSLPERINQKKDVNART